MKLVSWRFLFGSLILLLVDLLWVASSEITEYLYHEKDFNKPFFTAYTKSIMFSIYLLGFLLCDSWWPQKSHQNTDYYSIVSDSEQQNLTLDEDDDINDDGQNDSMDTTTDPQPDVSINCTTQDMELIKSSDSSVNNSNFLSDSVWLPIKRCSDTSSLSGKSETEDEESGASGDGHVFIDNDPCNVIMKGSKKNPSKHTNVNYKKSTPTASDRQNKQNRSLRSTKTNKHKSKKRAVRFSNLIEVRQLSDKHADDAFLSRLSYSSFMRIIYQRNRQKLSSNGLQQHQQQPQQQPMDQSNFYSNTRLNIRETALLAFYFTWIWFAAHLSFHMGLQYSEAGIVNVLSSTTPLFTLLLGILFPSGLMTDSLSLTKLLCVLMSIFSVAMISNIEPVNHSHPIIKYDSGKMNVINETILPLGSIWSLCGAFFYAVYIVLMRYNLAHDSMLNFPMFFGFIGLFSMVVMSPFIFLLNFTQIEVFQWPNKDQWFLILVNGLCGTVISELLWLLGSFMTSSLVGTIAVSFTIPFSVLFDIFIKDIEYPRLFFLGTIPMFFSFVIIVFVSQHNNWDPVLRLLERCLLSLGSYKFNRYGGVRLENTNSDSDQDFDPKTRQDSITSINHSACNEELKKLKNKENDRLPSERDTLSSPVDDSNSNSSSSSSISTNNRRFLNGKKDSGSSSSSSSSSSVLDTGNGTSTITRSPFSFSNKRSMADEDEHDEQTQSLIEAESDDQILI